MGINGVERQFQTETTQSEGILQKAGSTGKKRPSQFVPPETLGKAFKVVKSSESSDAELAKASLSHTSRHVVRGGKQWQANVLASVMSWVHSE